MTAEEWDACDDAEAMLPLVEAVSGRKSRLLACGACRRVWCEIHDERRRDELRAAELYADGGTSRTALARAQEEAEDGFQEYLCSRDYRSEIGQLYLAVSLAADDAISGADISAIFRATAAVAPFGRNEKAAQAALLRDIFGNPFRPVTFNPAWRTSDVMALAQGAYGAKAFDRLPILADALQDAGSDSEPLLGHLRDEAAPHVRGCWALDLILGKS